MAVHIGRQKITPSLWFDRNAEAAMNFYVSIFPNSKIISIKRYEADIPQSGQTGMIGKVLTGVFELEGQRFICLDGGPVFKISPAISFMVECDTQEEVDHYWSKLSAVKEAEQCGWLSDQFGVSWQIVPKVLGELMMDKDKAKADRVMQAMLGMKKLDIEGLERAAKG